MNSWKEIANYFGQSVRTVQRWEHDLQLPVHRIGKGKRSPVYAVVAELKFWRGTSARRDPFKVDRQERQHDPNGSRREAKLAARLDQPAEAVAESTVRQQRNTEVREKNILALKSRSSTLGKPVFALPSDATEERTGLARIEKWLDLADAAMASRRRKTP